MQENYVMKGKRMHDFLDGNGPVPAHPHSNGGGWVANTACVAATVYVGPQARVFGEATVLDYAEIRDRAEVSGHAMVRGRVHVCNRAKVQGHAVIEDDVILEEKAFIATNIRLVGDAKIRDHVTLMDFKSCLNCPLMPDDTYGARTENPCVSCLVGIMRSKSRAASKTR